LKHKDAPQIVDFCTSKAKEIKEKITTVTQYTGKQQLTSLPISNTDVKTLISILIQLNFLPTVDEFIGLYNKYYGTPEKPAEKDKPHRNPYKFNGFALAVFLASLIKSMPRTTSVGSSAAVARAAPASSQKTDLTGIPQKYFIWLGPTDKINWGPILPTIALADNTYCKSTKRTHVRTVNGETLNNQNKSFLTYNSKKIEELTEEEKRMEQQINQHNDISFLQSQSTAPDTYIHKVEEPGKYLYYELQKSVLEEEVSVHPERTSCKVKVHLYVIKRYAEDGICDRVYVEYSYGDLPENTDGDNPCSNTVDIPLVLKTKYVDNVKKELSAKITGFENAISLTFDRQRGEPAQATQTITAPRILSRGEHAGICTLMISPPISGGPKWDVAQATTIQSDAFRAVQEYITSNPLSINQIKVFSISNLDKSIHVHIIVKKIGDNNTLISAEYVSDNGETYELFNNQQSAIQRAAEKKIHHQQVSASGPSTTHSYSKSSY